jgi:FtsH-binding integral membrane protein
MLTGPQIILTLKVLVIAVTGLLLASLVALAMKRPRLHGQINTLFFVLTLATVIGFEVLLQFVNVSANFDDSARRALRIHLWFSVPSALLLPVMFYTGKTHRRTTHIACAIAFSLLWTGTFVTGVVFLPHQ